MKSIKDIFRSYAVLDSEGRHVNGTDKQSNHSYGDAYEGILTVPDFSKPQHGIKIEGGVVTGGGFPHKSLRDEVKLMMEVGVADGSCLRAWRDVFPNALIVGMDVHHSDRAHGDRIEFRIGDQRSQRDCEDVVAGRQFDLIVEDATHELSATLLTLLYLWPSVKPGGLYIVEEFANVGALNDNILALWPNVKVVDTVGPFGGNEPLVVFRKLRQSSCYP